VLWLVTANQERVMNLHPPQKNLSLDDAHDESDPPDFPNRKWNVQEAARFLGLSESTLNKLRLTGTGPPYMKLGRRVLYDLHELQAWAAVRKRNHTSE